MKKVSLAVLLTFLLVLSVAAVGWAEDPTQLLVVRASNNTLYKATCLGATCTGFTLISGNFTTQPTVVWDENLRQFVLWGQGTDNKLYRATFTSAGVFNNNWALGPAATIASPAGAAGSIINRAGRALTSKGSIPVVDINWPRPCTNAGREVLANLTFTTPRSARILLFADGIYAPGVANAAVDVCISDTTGACLSWDPVLASNVISGNTGEKRFALHTSTSGPVAAGTYNYKLTACADGAAVSGTFFWDTFEAIIVPDSY